MGFFDKMSALFDSRKVFSTEELAWYFHEEITRSTGSVHLSVGEDDRFSTNIGQIIWDAVRKEHPDAAVNTSSFDIVNNDGEITKVADEIYKIVYIGKINVKNRYDDSVGRMYFHVIIHTDKYAKISKEPEYKSTVNTSKNPIP